jgi:hypothetical protein
LLANARKRRGRRPLATARRRRSSTAPTLSEVARSSTQGRRHTYGPATVAAPTRQQSRAAHRVVPGYRQWPAAHSRAAGSRRVGHGHRPSHHAELPAVAAHAPCQWSPTGHAGRVPPLRVIFLMSRSRAVVGPAGMRVGRCDVGD